MHNLFSVTNRRRFYAAVTVIVLCVSLCSCKKKEPEPEPEPYDPYAGMVQVSNGKGGTYWITPSEILPVSSFTAEDFTSEGGFVTYSGTAYKALKGIDVSEHQQEINWDAVAASGVEFAVIRAGYRGYTSGSLNEDAYFRRNIEEANRLGLKVGIYFFSQALDSKEAIEEANYLLDLISGYSIDLPVFFDWEPIFEGDDIRTEEVTGEEMTECCLAFAQTIESAGYTPGVYFYRSQGYYDYDLDRLSKLVFWSSAMGGNPDFYYAHSFWQYSYTGKVDGISTDVDLNLMFEAVPASAQTPAPSAEGTE